MPGVEEIGRAIARAVNFYTAHPTLMRVGNTIGIYSGIGAAGIVAHQSGFHDLEKIVDAANIILTGSYAISSVNHLLPPGTVRDLLRAGIVAGMAYGAVGETREFVFNYDAPDLGSKIAEMIPFGRGNDNPERAVAAIAFGAYLIGRGIRGYSRERANALNPQVRPHH